ncbi:MAG: hypothetical protein JG718_04375 [Candidatus Thiothrix moscowensis]|nr:hypothetical protein [Candidatus Thiothrix moscowensis]
MKHQTLLFAALLTVSPWGSAETAQTYTYYDVGKPKTLQLMPNLVADFAAETENQAQARSVGENVVKSISPGAQLTDQGGGNARIWKTDVAVNPNAIQARSYGTAQDGGTLSPVFQEGGTLKALPGGVVVNFAAGTTQDQANDWAVSKGYSVKEKLSFGNYYLIDTPAGMESLNLANQWQASGEVVSSTPNWWRQLQAK